MPHSLVQGILNNDHGSISKAITLIENHQIPSDSFLTEIHSKASNAVRIGITGPPGAGKSSLTNCLIEASLANDKTVGVIAVDPTSPFTGGALLGDRVRMNQYSSDNRVFLRSIGNHCNLGGLADKVHEIGDVLAASGKDILFFETVGVGQGEHDIMNVADICVVVLVPESGDEIQLMKAGLIEIADLFVINKSDRSGANRIAAILKNILHTTGKKEKKELSVYNTIATKKDGISELHQGINNLLGDMKDNGELEYRRLKRYRERVYSLIRYSLEKSFWVEDKLNYLNDVTSKLDTINEAPDVIAKQLLKKK